MVYIAKNIDELGIDKEIYDIIEMEDIDGNIVTIPQSVGIENKDNLLRNVEYIDQQLDELSKRKQNTLEKLKLFD